MPLRSDIKRVLVIGSGPIIIGQPYTAQPCMSEANEESGTKSAWLIAKSRTKGRRRD
jgi:hypothetical protein